MLNKVSRNDWICLVAIHMVDKVEARSSMLHGPAAPFGTTH